MTDQVYIFCSLYFCLDLTRVIKYEIDERSYGDYYIIIHSDRTALRTEAFGETRMFMESRTAVKHGVYKCKEKI